MATEAEAIAITSAKAVLEGGEQALSARQGGFHEEQIAQELVPFGDWHPFPSWWEGARQVQGAVHCV